jgi:hypothetical protein
LPTVADETPCRRAASASDNSPFNTPPSRAWPTHSPRSGYVLSTRPTPTTYTRPP